MKVNEAKDFNEWFERLIVNNKTVQFKIDTGSQVNATVIKKYMESNLQINLLRQFLDEKINMLNKGLKSCTNFSNKIEDYNTMGRRIT